MPGAGAAARIGIVGLLVLLLNVVTGCAAAPVSTAGYVSGDGSITRLAPQERPAAPEIAGTTLDGDQWSSASASGKVLVYNVWGSWCAPCRAEAPALVAASVQTSEQAVFVGLNTRDLDPAAPKAFVRAFKVPYVNLYDPDGALLLKFGGSYRPMPSRPRCWLIRRDGLRPGSSAKPLRRPWWA